MKPWEWVVIAVLVLLVLQRPKAPAPSAYRPAMAPPSRAPNDQSVWGGFFTGLASAAPAIGKLFSGSSSSSSSSSSLRPSSAPSSSGDDLAVPDFAGTSASTPDVTIINEDTGGYGVFGTDYVD